MNHWCIKSDDQRINSIFPNNIDMICFQVRTNIALHKYIAWENFVVQGRFIVQKGIMFILYGTGPSAKV
uniref:Uncharacterized protein n=1 Tax=viral metagenome TaxID=1070528 RepID=A0A6C0KIA8_9ZZZZ